MPQCPVCSSPCAAPVPCHRFDTLARPPRRVTEPLARCASCGFWWITPPPDVDALLDAYRALDASHWAPTKGDARGYAHKRALVERFVPGGRALDVGCFHGELLFAMPDAFERFGVEPCASAAEVARSRGATVEVASALTAEPPGPFDAVFCMDTIEHIVDQPAFAARLAAWTAPEGVLVIETGDTHSLPARLMGPSWAYIGLYEHTCAHSARSLNVLMAQHGLVLLHQERREHTRVSVRQAARRVAAASLFRAASALSGVLPPLRSRTARPAPWLGGQDHQLAVFAHAGSRVSTGAA